MRREFKYVRLALFTFALLLFISTSSVHAAKLEDGTYEVDYVIRKAESDSVSMANDYFEKPAKLIVKDGRKYIQFTLNHSNWTKELQAPLGDKFVNVEVLSEDKNADTRDVKFEVDRDLTKPLEMKMHVLIKTMEPVYDHRYTVRFDFDMDKMEQAETSSVNKNNDTKTVKAEDQSKKESGNSSPKKETNPRTGDEVSLLLFASLLLVSAVLIRGSWHVIRTK